MEHLSPSGKYKLTVGQQPTKPGCWNYSTGEVTLVSTGEVIATVNRNYSCFPFSFVESHPNGHDYLICGENYQGQTVIELDTGGRRDFLPPEAKDGHAFCWATHEFDVGSKLLVVGGCYWACPYEYRFYNFADPMSGWPQLETDDYVDDDEKQPEITGDVIKTFQTYSSDDDDDDDDDAEVTKELAAVKTFKREGDKLFLQGEWVSDAERDRRQKRKEGNERYEAEMKLFKEIDPLYLRYRELVKEMPKADKYCGVGVTYEGWCPDFKLQERRWCHRLHYSESKGYTVDLEWAIKTGPIKLKIYKDGKSHEDKYFEHSVQGMDEAFEYTKKLLAE